MNNDGETRELAKGILMQARGFIIAFGVFFTDTSWRLGILLFLSVTAEQGVGCTGHLG